MRDGEGAAPAPRVGTIYVQRSPQGGYLADVLELPGCLARGTTRDDAVARVRAAFTDYLELLSSRGVSTEHWKDLDPQAFEVRDAPAPFTFPEDFRPMQEHELRDFLHRFEASRAALLALVRGISPDEIERRVTPDAWSIRQTLEHIALTEVALLSRLEKWPNPEFATLQAVHRMAFQRFSVMEPEDTSLDHVIDGRRWSTRKVMRRMLEHEYEHLGQIKEQLAALGSSERPPE
ncbi:MAG: type II toxin-antitoxin system HicB family antitoxin [Chloroflexota bacterium]|nr:type II toxin-antitoxin system HicB family antitoxin [Chloroflexota bacterium]